MCVCVCVCSRAHVGFHGPPQPRPGLGEPRRSVRPCVCVCVCVRALMWGFTVLRNLVPASVSRGGPSVRVCVFACARADVLERPCARLGTQAPGACGAAPRVPNFRRGGGGGARRPVAPFKPSQPLGSFGARVSLAPRRPTGGPPGCVFFCLKKVFSFCQCDRPSGPEFKAGFKAAGAQSSSAPLLPPSASGCGELPPPSPARRQGCD